MKINKKSQLIILLILLIMIGNSFTYMGYSKSLSPIKQEESTINGRILFAPFYSKTTYLIDSTGTVNHTWSSAYQPFTEAYWLEDGTILRPILSGGGGIQEIRWDGTLAWDYRYTVSGSTCHHDVKYLPNGNVLMIVWVTKTRSEYIAAGRNPSWLERQ